MNERSKKEEAPEIHLIPPINGGGNGEDSILLTEKLISSDVRTELRKQLELAGPLILVGFLQYSLQMISVVFIGHLGALALSSATMATCFAGVTGYYFVLGMASALDTFLGQAYGAKQYNMLGIYLQRAMFVLLLVNIPISFIWNFTEQIFKLCGQDPEISAQAGVYAKWLIPSLVPYALLQCQVRFLQAQNNVKPLIVATVLTTSIHVPIAWVLVFGIRFGNKGAALSTAISYWINVVLLGIYIRFAPACRETWTGFSKEGLKDLISFLSLAIPSAFMICYMCILNQLGILGIRVFSSYVWSSAKSEASDINDGNQLRYMFTGLQNPVWIQQRFKCFAVQEFRMNLEQDNHKLQNSLFKLAYVLLLQKVFVNLVLLLSSNIWGYIYTNDKIIVKFVASVIPVLVISNFMDGMQAVLSGTARGCGWQKKGAYVNLGAYYLVGIPLVIILTFVFHFEGKGLWMGIIGGSATQTSLLLVLTIYTDWEHQARKAIERVQASNLPSEIEFVEADFSNAGVSKEGYELVRKDSNLNVLIQIYNR